MTALKWLGIVALTVSSFTSIILCPHSKVEESFNLQATHDLYYHGLTPALQPVLHISSWFRNEISGGSNGGHKHVDETDATNASTNPINLYDHLQYPGVVPRTFTGPIILVSILSFLTVLAKPLFDISNFPLLIQALSRGLLCIFNLHAFFHLATILESKFSSPSSTKKCTIGGYFLLITASQFHLPYYSSRMLPNTFALVLVTHAYAYWIDSKPRTTLVLLVACATIFRCDIIILLATVGVTMLLRSEVTLPQAIRIGVVTGFVSLVVTVPFDSLLWGEGRLMWPEGEVLLFNTVENKSGDYGVSPWYWYFVKALPKGMLFTIGLVPFAFWRLPEYIAASGKIYGKAYFDADCLPFLTPVVGFIALYSILPHKEIRFIFVAFPILNFVAARGLMRLHESAMVLFNPAHVDSTISKKDDDYETETTKNNTIKKKMFASKWVTILLFLGGVGSVMASAVGSSIFIAISKKNYPGGDALQLLRKELEESSPSVSSQERGVLEIYVDVAAAMTGISLFGQRALIQSCRDIGGDKSAQGLSSKRMCKVTKDGYEHENAFDLNENRFHYLLSEQPAVNGYNVVMAANGFPSLDLRSLRIVTKDSIYVLQQTD